MTVRRRDLPIFVASYVVNFLSLVGCVLLLFEYARRPLLRKRTLLRPIFYQAATSLLWALGVAITFGPILFDAAPIGTTSPAACAALGALNQFAAVATFLWYTTIAFNSLLIFLAPVERPVFTQLEQRQARLKLEERVVWALAVVATLPPLFSRTSSDGYGPIRAEGKPADASCTAVQQTTAAYECWIVDSDRPASYLGELCNFGAFMTALLSGLALLAVVVRHRQRLLRFSGVFNQTIRFVVTFTLVWILQHIFDFVALTWSLSPGDDEVDLDDVDDDEYHDHGQFSFWHYFFVGCNVILKGAAGLLVFLSWYWSRALSVEADHKGAGTEGDPHSHSMEEYLRLSDEPATFREEEGGGEEGGAARRMGYPADERTEDQRRGGGGG